MRRVIPLGTPLYRRNRIGSVLGYACPMQEKHRDVAEWLRTPLGQRVYALERKHVAEALTQVFGWQLLQIGLWGDDHGLIAEARTQQKSVLARHTEAIPVADAPSRTGVLRSRADSLAISSDSIDAVLLPHTLEHVADPHAVLREVERIMTGEGHLIVLGFRPVSMWGARHMFSGAGFPPGAERLLSERRVRDWLKLLGFDVTDARRYLFTMPFGRADAGSRQFMERVGDRAWPLLAGAYMLKARKRVYTLTPIRPRWRTRTSVVGGLAEPAARHVGHRTVGLGPEADSK
jgi:SAM-dependent methyltransferase